MSVFWTIALGVSTSFIASLVFTFLFTRLKPRLKISSVIAHSHGTFKIKVVNKSRSSAINLKAELAYIRYFSVPGGKETKSEEIDLLKGELFAIDKYARSSVYATYSYRFATKQDIRQGFSNKNKDFIRFKIYAVHSLSNIGKVFYQEYSFNNIQDGDFPLGCSIELVKL